MVEFEGLVLILTAMILVTSYTGALQIYYNGSNVWTKGFLAFCCTTFIEVSWATRQQ